MHIVVNYYDPFSSVMHIPWVQDPAEDETTAAAAKKDKKR